MRARSIMLAATLIALSSTVSARSLSDDKFYQAARDAKFYCVLDSGTLQVMNEYNAPQASSQMDKVYSCIRAREATMEQALKAIPSKNADLRQSAKAVFAAWLTFSKSLARGITSNEADRGPEGLAFQSALDAYATEVRLAD